jgi:hypothetical protein
MSYNISDVLPMLTPSAKWVVHNDEIVEWNSSDITQPTEDEIKAEITRLQAEYDAQAYSRKRQAEYPSVQECVHAILDDQLDALQAKRALIKTKFPKG